MIDKLPYLQPEIVLFIATCVVMVLGLSRTLAWRRLCGPVAALALGLAAYVAVRPIELFGATGSATGRGFLFPELMAFAKVLVAGVGFLLLLLIEGTVDRREEEELAAGKGAYNPLRMNRAEFYAFFLFSLTGVMLCAGAEDLIWLFLALELTSLPTYIMVTISMRGTRGDRAQEAGVKYFFLGALGAATFLFGFALMYGGTGTTNLRLMNEGFAASGINSIAMAGLVLAILGVSFKVAAVPMHFYTPDVYQGASATVGAFLAFAPKAAGMFSLMLILGTVGWNYEHGAGVATAAGTSLPDVLRVLLWVMAALTMTVGNVLALLQSNVKRMLAYSSIAHSGYMLVGLVAGPGRADATKMLSGVKLTDGSSAVVGVADSGLAAVLFYLMCYGVMNLGAFAVLACMERKETSGERRDAETFQDLHGLWQRQPMLAGVLMLCSLSLLGLPPLLGFFGKATLFTSGLAAGETLLVIVLALNSAIAVWYYLRLAFAPMFEASEKGSEDLTPVPFQTRWVAAAASAAGVVVLAVLGNGFLQMCQTASGYVGARPAPPAVAMDLGTMAPVKHEAREPAKAEPHGAGH